LLQFMDFRGKYLIIAQLIFTIIYNVWGQAARGLKKNKEYSIAGVLVTLINLLSNLLLLIVFNLNVEGLIISNTIGYVVAIVYLEYKLRIYSYIDLNKINLNYRRKLYLYSIPLIWNNISWWFMNVSDRYMLTYWKGIEANGIYAIANKLPALIMMINSFFSLAWQDSAITEYKSKDMNEYYTKIFNIYMKIQLTLMIVLLAFTKVILRYMVSSEFFISWRYIPPIYIASIFSSFSVFYGTGYLMAKDTKGSLYTSMIGCLA
ncbi:oligosaccharide flippase family protein, partial [Clostridium neonatale]|uniref:oligosaccharide flippase family protein n=1 Tax=Clostridium neonatale TaxID=137838 RepID=UPI003D32B980